MNKKIKRLVTEYVDTILEPDVLMPLRAVLHDFKPSITIDESSTFTFLFGYIYGRISEKTTIRSKETRELIIMIKERLPEIKLALLENMIFDTRLTKREQ